MTDKQQLLEKILDVYGKLFYPYLNMKVFEIKEADGRIYLTHSESDIIVSLLPPIKNDNPVGK